MGEYKFGSDHLVFAAVPERYAGQSTSGRLRSNISVLYRSLQAVASLATGSFSRISLRRNSHCSNVREHISGRAIDFASVASVQYTSRRVMHTDGFPPRAMTRSRFCSHTTAME